MSDILNNAWKLSLRLLFREKVYALINLLGLSVGIACCLVVGLYLSHQLGYDRHFDKHERIYRIVAQRTIDGNAALTARVSPLVGPWLAEMAPEVEAVARFSGEAPTLFRAGDTAFWWDKVFTADSQVFDVFSHRIIAGDVTAALQSPDSIAVSASFARRYFGDEDAVGKVLRGEVQDYRVDVVFADLPDTTHLRYDVLIGRSPTRAVDSTDGRNAIEVLITPADYTYALLAEGVGAQALGGLLQQIVAERFTPVFKGYTNLSIAMQLAPEALGDIHLDSVTEQDQPRANLYYLYAFSAVAAFVLIVACINYVNLATARALRRAMDVGVRKLLGADRLQLAAQFLVAALLFTLLALVIGVELVHYVLDFTTLNALLGVQLELADLMAPRAVAGLAMGVVVLGLLSGLYPALYLAGAAPLRAVATADKAGAGGGTVRQGLMLLQFMISIGVIASVFLMFAQIRYVLERPLGFDPENKLTMVVRGADNLERLETFINELESHGLRAGATAARPGEVANYQDGVVETNEGAMAPMRFYRIYADEHYLDALGLQLSAGRNFTAADRDSEVQGVLVNETLVRAMGWNEPLGKLIVNRPVIGVVRDFNFQSLYEPLQPLVIRQDIHDFAGLSPAGRAGVSRILAVSIPATDAAGALTTLGDAWRRFNPEYPFEYSFLNDTLARLYDSEQRQMSLIGLFAGLCVLLSCLGLYGIAAFTTELRTREIGIRKVFGAATAQIILMLFRNIALKTLLVASVLASLGSYWIMSGWLENFHYREDIDFVVFLLASALVTGIAFLTVATQTFRAANARPVLALRCE